MAYVLKAHAGDPKAEYALLQKAKETITREDDINHIFEVHFLKSP